MNSKCWWWHSKQCSDFKCKRSCYMFYPVLKGMLEEPKYDTVRDSRLLKTLIEQEKSAYTKAFKFLFKKSKRRLP